VLLRGEGAGADAALEQSMILANPLWRALLAQVDAHGVTSSQLKAFARSAAAGELNHIHFRFSDQPGGDPGAVERYLRLCDEHRLSCSGRWGERDASGSARPAVAFADAPSSSAPLLAFTGASSNIWGERGSYNAGLGWDVAAVVSDARALVLPLRSAPAAAGAQPAEVTFDLTIRRAPLLNKNVGRKMKWMLVGTEQSGSASVGEGGSLALKSISLPAGAQYRNLVVAPAPPEWKLVYTRQPRATKPVPGTQIQEASNWQHATDVGRINGGIAEADVVIDDLEGNTRVIHDCTTSKQVCVAHEARVSPDGTKIAYSVGYGNQLVPVRHDGVDLGIREIPGLTHAELWIYDLQTHKKRAVPNHPARAIDRQPEWLNNEKLVFASNRGKTYPFRNPISMHQGKDQFGRGRCFNPPYCVSQEYGYGRESMSMQLWTINIDGTDARNITPHEQNALAPAVMTNGDILYSCWNSHENKSFDTRTAHSNKPATSKNKWWLCRTDGNGADSTVILNGHKTTTLKTREWLPRWATGGEGRSELRAIRSVAEIFRDRLAVTNYYRSNHVGSMGIIYGMDYGDPHVEGCSTARCYPDGESRSTQPGSGRYVPSSLVALTPYGTDQDNSVRRDAKGRAMGKSGYPAPLPNTDKEFRVTHGRGNCYEVMRIDESNRAAWGGEPLCQKGLYKVKVPMVTNPFDRRQMEPIAGGDQWHAWDGRAIAPYRDLLGQEMPDQVPALDPRGACYLQVVDAREAELYASAPRYDWQQNLYQQCAFQGCAVNTEDRNFHRENIAALTVFLPEMWDFSYTGGRQQEYASFVSNTGHKSMAVLGSQPLQADGSVKMQVPCETPIVMAGTDKDGMVVAYDVMLHSLRAGETRTCHGCHDGHSEERAAKIKRTAVERFAQTLAADTVPALPQKTPPVTFDQVRPILEKRCSGCHRDMTDRDGMLYSRVAQDYEQYDWAWAKKQPGVGQRRNVRHVLILRAGRGYAVGDRLRFQPGGAAGQVAAVGPGGGIKEIRLTSAGDGYGPRTPVEVVSAAGSGAKLTAMTDFWVLPRPYSSKWVARFARDSLLYWKCMGSRQDGRSDRQYDNDIDFGPAHDTEATPEECQVIGRWIDTGIQHNL
ncbi:MAG: hypothetical protein R3228_10905, partial [Halioglobus sp.]|nr:hypothetical protein [Halioglobus sp.]